MKDNITPNCRQEIDVDQHAACPCIARAGRSAREGRLTWIKSTAAAAHMISLDIKGGNHMQNELKITFQDMAHSAAVEARIREKAAKLEKLYPRLTGCHVVVSEPHRHQQRHRLLAVGITIGFPGGEVAVTRDDNEDVYVLLRDAFDAAGRELEKATGRRKGRAAPHHALESARPGVAQEADHE